MDFESVADELYNADRDDFTALREQRAAEAREAGDKELATRIHRLRKPTSAAWLVNRLARHRPDEVAQLADLGEALRQAHSELAGDRLRTLSRQRHRLVRSLAEQASEVGDVPVSESINAEITATLDAAVADADSARAVTEGRLTSALQPPDAFAGEWLPTGVPAEPAPSHRKPGKITTRKAGAAARRTSGEKQAEPEEEAEPGEETEPASERVGPARRRREALRQAREAAAEARSTRDEARRELRAAEHAEKKARERTEAARDAFDAADREVADAEQRVADLLEE